MASALSGAGDPHYQILCVTTISSRLDMALIKHWPIYGIFLGSTHPRCIPRVKRNNNELVFSGRHARALLHNFEA